MLNYYYIYGLLWAGVLLLYDLGLSTLNQPLAPFLHAVLLVSIVYCLLMGYSRRSEFRCLNRDEGVRELSWGTLALVTLMVGAVFVTIGYIPLLSQLRGELTHNDLREAAPFFLRTLSQPLLLAMSAYNGWAIANKMSGTGVVKSLILIVLMMLYASRFLIMLAFVSLVLMFGTTKIQGVSSFRTVYLIMLALSALWLFGAFGNIQQGYHWSDTSYLLRIGYLEDGWPSLIPSQLAWAYSYITSPLANLNYAVTSGLHSTSAVNYVYSFIPMAFAKRLPLYIPADPPLAASYFTACPALATYYWFGAEIGLMLGIPLQLLILRFYHSLTKGSQLRVPALALIGTMVALSFFSNSYVYPTTSYPLILIVIWVLLRTAVAGYRHIRISMPTPLTGCRHERGKRLWVHSSPKIESS